MQVKPVDVRVGRDRLGIVDEVGEYDEVRLHPRAGLAEQRQFLRRVVVADAEIEAIDLLPLLPEVGDHLMGECLLFDSTSMGVHLDMH